MLQIQNLNLNLNEQNILIDINFEINAGEILSIIGPSGCGKSSILKSIVGIIKEHDGTILLNNIDITNWPINKRNITLAFQDFSLFPHKSSLQVPEQTCHTSRLLCRLFLCQSDFRQHIRSPTIENHPPKYHSRGHILCKM